MSGLTFPGGTAAVSHTKALHQARLGASVTSSLQFRTQEPQWEQVVADQLLHHLEAYVLTDHLVSETQDVHFTKTVVFEAPETWWDQFKADQQDATSPLWRWVARRWPARYHRHKATVSETKRVTMRREHQYPQANIAIPDLGKPILVEYFTEEKI